MLDRQLTPAEVATRWGCSPDHVIDLVRGRHLTGFSISPPGCKRPRYRITQAALSEYEKLRQCGVPEKPVRRQPKKAAGIIEFYK